MYTYLIAVYGCPVNKENQIIVDLIDEEADSLEYSSDFYAFKQHYPGGDCNVVVTIGTTLINSNQNLDNGKFLQAIKDFKPGIKDKTDYKLFQTRYLKELQFVREQFQSYGIGLDVINALDEYINMITVTEPKLHLVEVSS